ncbi:MAG: hypothetical protein ACRDPE_04900, partial [Solirubrobacterales bacterium]
VQLYMQKTARGHEHILELNVYPMRGLAVVDTVIDTASGLERGRGVAYALAIPPTNFEGWLDLTVPRLGRFVGAVSSEREGTAKCVDGAEPATFKGRLDFHGAGGYESWRAKRVEASVTRACNPRASKSATPEDLFGAVQEYGPLLGGPASFRFLARARDRSVNLIVWSDPYRHEGTGQFVGFDREWLPGEVAVQRWVNRPGIPLEKTVAIGPGGDHPTTIDFHPPKPFFGTGHYDRRSHALTGSLGANFLGLRLRLARHPLIAELEDEEVQPPRQPG